MHTYKYKVHVEGQAACRRLERSGPNQEPGTIRVYVTNGQRNGLYVGRKVGPCPGGRRRWVVGLRGEYAERRKKYDIILHIT